MILKNLTLKNFRNYEKLTVEFSDGVNVLIGENAQGKTNLLEAIYVLALTKSHRSSNDKELISWKSTEASVSGRVKKTVDEVPLELIFSKNGKQAKVNHLEQARLSQYVGQLNVILFAPEDLSIVKGAPALRRHFMDMEFGQMSSKYLYNSGQYRQILKQRNQYLKQLQLRRANDRVYLQVLSDQLSAYGAEIIIARNTFLEKLQKWANEVHQVISNEREILTFHYATQVKLEESSTVEEIYQQLIQLYADNEQREIDQGSTQFGPQRDDLQFMVNGKNVQTFGSQGQQRTTALSVKLAEIDLMKETTGEYPVLLLDDVLSELDDQRQTQLLAAIQNKVQTFLTTTSLSGVARQLINEPTIFRIDKGTVTKEES